MKSIVRIWLAVSVSTNLSDVIELLNELDKEYGNENKGL